jgi:hypothetical protein
MSVTDAIVWFLPPLAGVALGLRMRSSALAILLGFVLVLASVVVWGYSWNYPNGACEPGEPCRLETVSSKSSPLSCSSSDRFSSSSRSPAVCGTTSVPADGGGKAARLVWAMAERATVDGFELAPIAGLGVRKSD